MFERVVTAVAVATVTVAVLGCAKSANQVAASYVSPLAYESYSCDQLGQEAQRISSRVAAASGAQDNKATNDAVVTAAAVVIFWPAAFFVGGDDETTAELARLKGEFETVEKVSIQKECGFEFRRAG